MMEIKLKSRNSEKLHRFSAFPRKSVQNQSKVNFNKISKNCDEFLKKCIFLALIMLNMPIQIDKILLKY